MRGEHQDMKEETKRMLWAVSQSIQGLAFIKKTTSDRKIRATYGASVPVLARLWQMVQDNDNDNNKIRLMHFLWGMRFLKSYKSDDIASSEAGCSPKTWRKWAWRVITALSELHINVVSKVLSFTNSY